MFLHCQNRILLYEKMLLGMFHRLHKSSVSNIQISFCMYKWPIHCISPLHNSRPSLIINLQILAIRWTHIILKFKYWYVLWIEKSQLFLSLFLNFSYLCIQMDFFNVKMCTGYQLTQIQGSANRTVIRPASWMWGDPKK